ncbi:MAG: hypothetical protein JSS50_04835 [Proteobacteria bacterium]|nr:hypothetical protein [Pseudomonadota bacterium]
MSKSGSRGLVFKPDYAPQIHRLGEILSYSRSGTVIAVASKDTIDCINEKFDVSTDDGHQEALWGDADPDMTKSDMPAFRKDFVAKATVLRNAIYLIKVEAAVALGSKQDKDKAHVQELVNAMYDRADTFITPADIQLVNQQMQIVEKALGLPSRVHSDAKKADADGTTTTNTTVEKKQIKQKRPPVISYSKFNNFMDDVVKAAQAKSAEMVSNGTAIAGPLASLYAMIEAIAAKAYPTDDGARLSLKTKFWAKLNIPYNLNGPIERYGQDPTTLGAELKSPTQQVFLQNQIAVCRSDLILANRDDKHPLHTRVDNKQKLDAEKEMLDFIGMLAEMPEGKHTANLWKRGLFFVCIGILLSCAGALVGAGIYFANQGVGIAGHMADAIMKEDASVFFNKLLEAINADQAQFITLLCILAVIGGGSWFVGMSANPNSPMYAIGDSRSMRDNMDEIFQETAKAIAEEAAKAKAAVEGAGKVASA